ncbi:MAG: ABC transporter permease [Nocardioidaceae bacterium]|nr:ABC transporter permease [Nocardioidaceae bacterium]
MRSAKVVVGLALVLAIVGPWLAPYDPNASDLARSFGSPSPDHLLGLDSQGRDILSRLLTGARSSLLGPLAVVAVSMLVGVLVALVAAWAGGWFDALVSSTLEIMFAFPGLLLAMLVTAVFGPGLWTAALALSVAYVPYTARVMRSVAITERGKAYVKALEIQGFRATTICRRHLVPNLSPLIAAQATLFFGYAMVDLAILSFFGLGVQFPNADWGVMVGTGQSGVLQGHPAEALSAGACVVLLVIAVNVLGERLAGVDAARLRPRRVPRRLRSRQMVPGGAA